LRCTGSDNDQKKESGPQKDNPKSILEDWHVSSSETPVAGGIGANKSAYRINPTLRYQAPIVVG
jgi:hypothetical protein